MAVSLPARAYSFPPVETAEAMSECGAGTGEGK